MRRAKQTVAVGYTLTERDERPAAKRQVTGESDDDDDDDENDGEGGADAGRSHGDHDEDAREATHDRRAVDPRNPQRTLASWTLAVHTPDPSPADSSYAACTSRIRDDIPISLPRTDIEPLGGRVAVLAKQQGLLRL